MLVYRLLHHDTTVEEVPLNISGRALELCGPAIRLFNSEQLAAPNRKALDEIRLGLSHFLRKKGELDKKVKELVICDVLTGLFDQMDNEEAKPGTSTLLRAESYAKRTVEKNVYGEKGTLYVIAYDEICTKIMQEMEGNLISQRTFESAEYGKITHDSILSTCRSLYGAGHERITNGSKRLKALSFNKDPVIEAGKNFEVVSEIKILNEDEEENQAPEDLEDKARWHEWTNGKQPCTSVPIFRNGGGEGDNDDRQDTGLEDSQNEVSDVERTLTNTENINDISKDSHDQPSTNLSLPQNYKKLVHEYTESQNHAQKEAQTLCTNPSSSSECDLRNQEGADRFKAEVERRKNLKPPSGEWLLDK